MKKAMIKYRTTMPRAAESAQQLEFSCRLVGMPEAAVILQYGWAISYYAIIYHERISFRLL
jgi:hypothetical protein